MSTLTETLIAFGLTMMIGAMTFPAVINASDANVVHSLKSSMSTQIALSSTYMASTIAEDTFYTSVGCEGELNVPLAGLPLMPPPSGTACVRVEGTTANKKWVDGESVFTPNTVRIEITDDALGGVRMIYDTDEMVDTFEENLNR